jgi:hypothetical protein
VDRQTEVAFGRLEVALGAAECAAMQTEHFNASVALEWWCATTATADHSVSNRHKNAIRFQINRMGYFY